MPGGKSIAPVKKPATAEETTAKKSEAVNTDPTPKAPVPKKDAPVITNGGKKS